MPASGTFKHVYNVEVKETLVRVRTLHVYADSVSEAKTLVKMQVQLGIDTKGRANTIKPGAADLTNLEYLSVELDER